ncbi:uncharacterized protein [Periplaneta americana]|uniref:uncharacterized protein n=1 Tax=Periplaneta americana TaxID=6978 RepID=UPI0037E81014
MEQEFASNAEIPESNPLNTESSTSEHPKSAVLGDILQEDLEYYIPRVLQITDVVNRDILSHSATESQVTFAISGSSHGELQEAVPRNKMVYTMETWQDGRQSENGSVCVAINSEDDFLKLLNTTDNVHWLHDEKNELKWKHSKGDMDIICRNLKNSVSVCKDVKSLTDISHRVAIVSAESGMGKSTFLSHLAQATEKISPPVNIFVLDLTQHHEKLSEFQKELNVVDFLVETVGVTPEEKDTLKCKLEKMEDVCVVVDGYSEIDSNFSENVILLLQKLLATKLRKLWIAVEPEVSKKLEKSLSSIAFTFQPFSEENQTQFLTKYWKNALPDVTESTLNNFADKLLLTVRRNLVNDVIFKLNPLQLKILAVANEVHLSNFSGESTQHLQNTFNVVNIYSEFINRKLVTLNKDATESSFIAEFQEIYMTCALLTFLSREEVKKLTGTVPDLEKIKHFVKTAEGHRSMTVIKNIIKEKAIFVHETFVGYFAALWFHKNYKRVSDFLREKLFDQKFEILRYFFDRVLCQKSELHLAVLNRDVAIVERYLSDAKFDVNLKDEGGRTVLHMAVTNCAGMLQTNDVSIELLGMLLQHGADPSVEDKVFRWRPLRLADKIGVSPLVIGLILQKQPDFKDLVMTRHNVRVEDYAQKALRTIARNGFTHFMIFLMKCDIKLGHEVILEYRGCKTKATILHEAARFGQLKLMKFLLDHKANPEARDSRFDTTPLMWAAEAGQLGAVRLLIQGGAKVWSRDEHGSTALLRAAEKGKLDVVKVLFIPNFDIDICDKYNDNLLHYAVRSGNLSLITFVVDVLRRSGRSLDARNHVLETPLWWAAKSGQVLIAELLLQCGSSVKVRDSVCGYTPLHIAAREGHLPIVQSLLQYGANVSSRDEFGRTPAEVAHWYKKTSVSDLLRSIERRRLREKIIQKV